MTELATALRNQLSKTIVSARRTAEAGARAALESLAVERHEPYKEMTPEQRQLRNRLRAHGRQLRDRRDKQTGKQAIKRLAHEVAYAHWHRMLFARFLAENNLLIHPEFGASMSLDDIRELAHEANENPDAMAASFAQANLPQIFSVDDPVLEVQLAPNVNQELNRLLDSLPTAVFTADDSLGWTYQYWQSEKKDEVNASGEKIGADELPAVTQLFTEHYMVLFLYHNTIGAWHAGKVLAENPVLAESASSEDELRAACAVKTAAGEKNWEYLRFVREPQEGDADDNPTGPWRPAAGTFEGWPKTAKELKVLDPCCGSGHFLVVGFKLLVGLRIHEEGHSIEEAIRAVLADNLFGLELDQRCTQIAAFNVAMAAWKLAGKPIELPPLNIACSGLSIGSSKKEWLALAGDNQRLQAGMENLYELFQQAPELGSLIDTKAIVGDMFEANFTELQPLLKQAMERESGDVEFIERAIAAQGMAAATELLANEYTLVISNVPYLLRRKQSKKLYQYLQDTHTRSKHDLATAFLERLSGHLSAHGTTATVSPSNWLYLKTYEKLRRRMLEHNSIDFLVQLGAGAFQAISGEVVTVVLVITSKVKNTKTHTIRGMDISSTSSILEKTTKIKHAPIVSTDQAEQNNNPNCNISLASISSMQLLENYASAFSGLRTGDKPRFTLRFWEIDEIRHGWVYSQESFALQTNFTGCSSVLLWEDGQGQLCEYQAGLAESSYASGGWKQGWQAWGKRGVLISQMGKLKTCIYCGSHFEIGSSAIIAKRQEDVPAIWAYCSTADYVEHVRKVNPSLFVTNASLVQVPFDIDYWKKVAEKQFPKGLPEPQSDDLTQWIFHGYPANTKPIIVLQVAVARLLDYRWPAELDSEMRLADEARKWVSRCNKLKDFADDDGIVCLSATRGEANASARLRELLAAAFGDDWSANKEKELLAAVAGDNKPATSLETWLRDKYFEEHCKLFQNRPFIWHIWDGNKDGFHCLVNAHKLTGPMGKGRKTLESITYSYLKDWIDRQRDDQQQDVEGADAKLAAALDLQSQLEKILAGEPPYDLFVRWKPLHEQAAGWEPDINDGVRLNIRPFMNAELRKGGKKGAGILRAKPNIKWGKDRGKEPESLRPKEDFPWFWGASGDSKDNPIAERTDYTPEKAARAKMDGNRWNDLHYTKAVKKAAQDAYKKRESGS